MTEKITFIDVVTSPFITSVLIPVVMVLVYFAFFNKTSKKRKKTK